MSVNLIAGSNIRKSVLTFILITAGRLIQLLISQQHADMLRFESAQDRYQKLVKSSPQLVLRAPLVYIASYLQMTPETLSRVRTAVLLNS